MVERIRALCEQRQLNINQLEKLCGLCRGSIARWDDNRPSVDKALKVAEYFDVSIDYLLGNEDIKKEPADNGKLEDATIKEIADITSAMTQEQREALLAYLRTLQ